MSEDIYATPSASLTASSSGDAQITQTMLDYLRSMKPWMRFLSILGFISSFFMIIAGSVIISSGGAMTSATGQALPAGVSTGIGAFYIAMSLLYLFPSVFLFKSASAIGRTLATPNTDNMETALKHQKSFWRFVGILTLAFVVLAIIGIGAAIMLPMMLAG